MDTTKINCIPASPIRCRKWTRSDGSHGAPHCISTSPQKYCQYGFSRHASTTVSSPQVVELFQDEQPHHQAHRLGRTPLLALERAELLLKVTPRDFSRQLVDRSPRIELLGQRGQ